MRKITKIMCSVVTTWTVILMIPPFADAHVAQGSTSDVHMRKFPYPYQAMLAISSDSDHETLRKFNLIHQFINTTDRLPSGKQGLGLDVSDSFFMYNASDLPAPIDVNHLSIRHLLTYFRGTTSTPYAADLINRYIHCGWIDTIHTYGDFSMADEKTTRFRRALALRGVTALQRAGDALTVWVDHGNKANVDNFGSYGKRSFYDYQQGANPTSPYYHTDLTIPYGIQFVWADEASSTFGHKSMLYPIRLPDGRKVWGFWRRTNRGMSSEKGIDWDWSVGDLAKQLDVSNLEALARQGQYAILAQHLAANNTVNPLPADAEVALTRLAREEHSGHILVARTSRLLAYNVAEQYIHYRVWSTGNQQYIQIASIDDPVLGHHLPTLDEVRGVTFYTRQPNKTIIEIGNRWVPQQYIARNPSDGRSPSIEIKWFPPDTHNYAIHGAQIN